MVREFVTACQELDRLIEGLPKRAVARARAAALDPEADTAAVAAELLDHGASARRLAAALARTARTAPDAVRALASATLDEPTAARIAPYVALHAWRSPGAAGALSSLAARLEDDETRRLVSRALRRLFLDGGCEAAVGALPGLLRLGGASLHRDDAALCRLDLLLRARRLDGRCRAALGEHLTASEEAHRSLVARGSRGSTTARWRAASLAGCVSDGVDALAICGRLVHDDSVSVWRAAAASLGRVAGRDQRARQLVAELLAPEAPITHRRHGAAALGTLHAVAPDLVDAALGTMLKRGSDPWLVASVALALPDLAAEEPEAFAAVRGRLKKISGPPLIFNMAQVAGELALAGHLADLDQLLPAVVEAVEQWHPRDPGTSALRWAARDALTLTGALDTPPALGTRCRRLLRLLLDGAQRDALPDHLARALEAGWAQLHRIDEVDTSVGIEGRGRLLFEVRDLAQALFGDDDLFIAARLLERGREAEVRALFADLEALRARARASFFSAAEGLLSRDRFRRLEIARGAGMAASGRFSAAGGLEPRQDDGRALARRLGAGKALHAIGRLKQRRMQQIAAAGLAQLLSAIGARDPIAQLEAATGLLLADPDPELLEAVAHHPAWEEQPLLEAVAAAARAWSEEPDEGGLVTASNLTGIGEQAPPGLLRSALLELARIIEHLGAPGTAEAIGTDLPGSGEPPLAVLARALSGVWTVAEVGVEGLRSELFGETGEEDAEAARRVLTEARHRASARGERLARAANRVTDLGRKLAAATAPAERLDLARELEHEADDLISLLHEDGEPSLGSAVARALEGWRAALSAERSAAREAVTTARQAGAVQASDTTPVPQTIGPGRLMGDFELLDEIGRGGMGVVYKARQVSLDRFVAVKVMLPGALKSPSAVQRFKQEARLMARWSHESIVRVIAFDDSGPAPYLVTELVDGQPLEAVIASGAVDAARAAQIAADVAGALIYAHGDDVVHRDISSTNVLIRNDGKTLLMDFGIALLVGEERLSMAGQVFGNPVYISPEQCVSPEEVGTSADLFALGVLTYQMLSGSLPFSGKTYNELMAQRLTRDPLPLSGRRPGLPGELCRFVHRMMDREPERRPRAAEVVEVLRAASRTLQRSRADAGPAAVRFEPARICLVCMALHGLDAVTIPEQTQEILAAWFAATRRLVLERGGAWSGAGSHRVYGRFGPDAAREALVSVRAATSAVRRLAQLHGAPVSVRAGLAVGQAFIGHDGAPAVAGPVVDLAERLAASDLDEAALRLDENAFALAFADALAGGKKVPCRRVGEVLFVHGWE